MKIGILAVLFSLSFNSFLSGQSIIGNLSQLGNQAIRLDGFNGFKTYPISNTLIDGNGNFSLTYSDADFGMGYLISIDEKPLFIILSGEEIEIVGESLQATESIKVIKGQENQWFEQYAQEQPKREQALSAWTYLNQIYTLDSLFLTQKLPREAIINEKQRIQKEDLTFLNSLAENSFVHWFLPTRKLVSSVSAIAQYRTEELPATIEAFRTINYADPRLYKSGLLKDAIESHFWLLENSGRSLDEVFLEMEKSIDLLLPSLLQDNEKLNEIAKYLFNLLEGKSLFQAAAYLATQLLNDQTCTLNPTLSQQLEGYRKMRIGNIASDIIFTEVTYFPQQAQVASLKEINSNYKLVVFAAGWCSHCLQEIPQLLPKYQEWKQKGVEIILVSLDENLVDFKSFAGDFPFISTVDFKKWESQSALDYHVFGTPSFYLLDKELKIILKPNSVKHFEAWVDWNLK